MITTSRAEEIAKARGVTVEIVDNRDGTVWEVAGVFRAGGWGLDHLRADVRRVEGQS